jgi:hypothetical protein
MTRVTAAVISLCAIFLVCSCASQKTKAKKPPPKFHRMVLAREIDESGTIGVPKGKTSEFHTQDKQVVAFYLMRAIKGEADANDDGWSSVKEVYAYVRDHVRRQSRRMQAEQTPSIVPASSRWRDVALSRKVN